jgi:Haloacid Dehalogenase superfamily, subfamily IB, phosphoserine phosphatase-like/2,3-diketo-5-methylthio-1-phosphopentane phosphatase
MLPVGAVLADFDGTACLHDVGVCLLNRFGDPDWTAIGEAYERGDRTYRELLTEENAMLKGTREEMLAFVLDHCPMDPTFAPFVSWLRERGLPLTMVSDGSSFHIEPMLAAAGLTDIPVITNDFVFGPDGRFAGLAFPNAHPVCVGCGTCKMLAVTKAQAGGPVAFIGDGVSDRFAAQYADVVFAKRELPAICESVGVAYRPWTDFDDVRTSLESGERLPGAPAPIVCPGWTLP